MALTNKQTYAEFKTKHPDCVLILRIGDYYNLYGKDAEIVSKALNLTRFVENGICATGFYYCRLGTYLPRLMKETGLRFCICDPIV
ncbi:MAG: hypothetical protein II630_01005 [Bacteroidales bacterium]|nr:hypothetical protein [Bacteroidales bacterium]